MSELLSRFLDTNGDGSGTKIATGDYSGGATDFYIQPAASETFEIARLIVHIKDQNNFSADSYGKDITLTNGISIVTEGNQGQDLCDGIPIMTNADWGRLSYDIEDITFGSGSDFVNVRWTFSKFGQPLILKGAENDKLIVRLNDSFTGLLDHTFMVQGLNLGEVI